MHNKLWITSLLTGVLVTGCGTSVNVDYDETINFSALRSFTLKTAPQKPTDDPRLDSALVQQRITAAIERNLLNKGLIKKDKQADMQVSYWFNVKQEIETSGSSVHIGVGTFSRRTAVGFGYGFPASDVQSYDRGILTIDITDSKTNKLLWRGSSGRRLYDGSTPDESKKIINEIVNEILELFPPQKKEPRSSRSY